jgi:hypothetical protein
MPKKGYKQPESVKRKHSQLAKKLGFKFPEWWKLDYRDKVIAKKSESAKKWWANLSQKEREKMLRKIEKHQFGRMWYRGGRSLPHDNLVIKRIKELESQNKHIVYADLPGYKDPDIIWADKSKIVCEDIKVKKPIEIEKVINLSSV